MDPALSQHYARMRQLREAFAEANERLVARLRNADDLSAQRVPGREWSAAQIGWHVAAVTTRFAGLISGDAAGAQALPDGFAARPWAEVAAGIPVKLQAPASYQPPRAVRRALDRTHGRVEEASRLLGISRKGLFLKRRRWGFGQAS